MNTDVTCRRTDVSSDWINSRSILPWAPTPSFPTTRWITTTKGEAGRPRSPCASLPFIPTLFLVDNGWNCSGLHLWCGSSSLCWETFDGSHKRGTRSWRGAEKGETVPLQLLIHSHLSYRARPLILIGTPASVCQRRLLFIIQSAPELSTWISKSRSYLATQNWISPPTRAGMEEAVSTFILVLPSYRDRILFFLSLRPVESRFLATCVQCTASIHDTRFLLICSPGALISFSSFFSTNFYMWGGKKSRIFWTVGLSVRLTGFQVWNPAHLSLKAPVWSF